MVEQIGKKIKIIANQSRRRFEKEMVRLGIDMPSTQARILGYIYRESLNNDIFQKDIEEEFDIRRSTATNILQLLEKSGYIERVNVVHDARLKKIVITDKGIGIHEELLKAIISYEDSLTSIYTKEELDTLLFLLNKLSDYLMED